MARPRRCGRCVIWRWPMPDGFLGLSQRLPPQNQQAEQALLGALLANNKGFALVGEFLEGRHFADPINGRIYDAIRARIVAGKLADPISLKAEFEHSGALDEVGGVAYLAQLLSCMVGLINAGEYGRAIRDAWHRRELIDLGETLVNDAFAPGDRTAAQLQSNIEARMQSLAENDRSIRGAMSLDDAVAAAMQAADEAARRQGPAGLSTGMPSVDERLGGLEDGTLTVIAGRPGMGKSALVTQWALAAARQGVGVLAISLEMSATQLGRRILSVTSGVPMWRMKRGQHADCAETLVKAQRELHGLPFTIEDGGGLTAAQIAVRCRAAHRRHGLGLIMVDHLHIVRPEDGDVRQGATWAVGRISGAMKRLAKEFNCPVLLAAQLNRGVDGREDKRPTLPDLRQSGDIEQDADAVGFVYRPEYYLGNSPPEQKGDEGREQYERRMRSWHDSKASAAGKAELIFAKVRDGEPGTLMLQFDAQTTSFREPGNGE